jgi:hypothetical protein
MRVWQWAEWIIVVLLIGAVVTVAADLILRRFEAGAYRPMKDSVRSHASRHASSHSAEERSKKE